MNKDKKTIPYQNKKILVQESSIHGFGIIAKKPIKRGESIGVVRGKLVNKFVIKNRKDSLLNPNWVGIDKNVWIDPLPPFVYLNHSCNPNTGVKGKKTIVAIRDIKKGEEIHIDYSIIEVDPYWHMKCRCKEKNCRGTITSIQKLPEGVYLKYLPFISKGFQAIYREKHHLSR